MTDTNTCEFRSCVAGEGQDDGYQIALAHAPSKRCDGLEPSPTVRIVQEITTEPVRTITEPTLLT